MRTRPWMLALTWIYAIALICAADFLDRPSSPGDFRAIALMANAAPALAFGEMACVAYAARDVLLWEADVKSNGSKIARSEID